MPILQTIMKDISLHYSNSYAQGSSGDCIGPILVFKNPILDTLKIVFYIIINKRNIRQPTIIREKNQSKKIYNSFKSLFIFHEPLHFRKKSCWHAKL